MATLSTKLVITTTSIFFAFHFLGNTVLPVRGANWCVARSDASNQALQTALDYACAAGADCTQIQSNGLCFLPNTIQAHASYAFNSYFQRKGMAPGSCDFAGTATVARTDPSYGSCVYPSSMSAAGGTPTTASTTPTTPPATTNYPNTTPTLGDGSTNGLNPGTTPSLPADSEASLRFMANTALMTLSIFLAWAFTLPPIL
ncbi:hypothetical protein Tsubulata_003046 [Turnera subulata]|uniref:X8 domain-containing protein n=1 Tax=Turnera subulata TaxID=218843 RepID=A0A9Q0JGH9_9ROSI|nr:hypothetical protein Tsubulata_003046 [Turnera subulata]